MEFKAACKIETLRTRHSLKNQNFTQYRLRTSRTQSIATFFLPAGPFCLFQIPHVTGTRQCWLLCMASFFFFFLAACIRILFFYEWIMFFHGLSPLYLFISLWVLWWLFLLTLRNNHSWAGFVWTCFPLSKCIGVELSDHMLILFGVLRNCQCISQKGCFIFPGTT